MSVERRVGDVMDLLDQVTEHLHALEAPGDATEVAGEGPAARENRTVHTAHAALARQRAVAMRADLEDIRAEARRMAGRARETRSGVPSGADGDDAVRRAARELASVTEPEAVDAVLARAVREAVPGAVVAGVCRRRGPDDDPALAVTVGDDALAGLVDAERTGGGGPCREALDGDAAFVEVPDVPADPRWPALSARALELGLCSVLAHRLVEGPGERGGVLVAWSRSGGGRGPRARQRMESLVDLAGVAAAGARRIAQLQQGLESRDVIGQAKGILVHRDGLEPAGAFDALVAASQHANMKLRDVAAWLVAQELARRRRGSGAAH